MGNMTTENNDIRWIQRLDNYKRALRKLNEAVLLYQRPSAIAPEMKELLQEGLIQRFEYTQELAWNVMKDYATYQGIEGVMGSRDAIRTALRIGIIDDARWMKTITDRNLSSHDYNDETADLIAEHIVNDYLSLFNSFEEKMEDLKRKV